ncbi:glycoside hydrolase family 130 protein [Flavihumibacter sp. CACIAM 22H1]|uniref:glycoside hydrolase family 130 protein n=1 Tax=Flavihumibacter sp. CACIAM 22H1 TaxID=1812911 RepID=UPI0007A82E67|nr:glycoside hydrolase family 130 protein [Flavihumibacter sp. CACIAM 22H1]KYP12932.1 MAG: glycosidase [Flavihumibacter sp. CACIAM 22H1]
MFNKPSGYLFALLLFVLAACGVQKKEPGQEEWMLTGFLKSDSVNPCLSPGMDSFPDPIRKQYVQWELKDVFNPAAVVKDGKVYLLYRAEDSIGKYNGTSRIGLAESEDGLHFTKKKEPVLFPAEDAFKALEWEGGCEDPRIVEDSSGRYILTYTAYDGQTARLMVASSTDLVNWTKHGSIFSKTAGGKYVQIWSKSGAIVTKPAGDKLVAVRINGKYWMYWGESNIYAATSDNLIDWEPVPEPDPSKRSYDTLRKHETFKVVFSPRQGKFDSYLVEPGPPAVLTDKGILFIYNSRNDPARGDTSLPGGTYAAGQILLRSDNPMEVIDRSASWFIRPDRPFEISGQVNHVIFAEGLVRFKDKWFLYYGTADSKIGVAVRSH